MDSEEHEESQEEEMDEEIHAEPISQLPPSGIIARNENNTITVRYRECLKNHAVNIGGHATDGCGEFMPSGEENTLDALKCAACNCHRNFHRKQTQDPFSQFYRAPPPTVLNQVYTPTLRPSPALLQQRRPLTLPPASTGGTSQENEQVHPSSEVRKRFRTRFTQEQKERMVEFAERLGWRIQKHDEAAVEEFCAETGVKRPVLKIWMHNNKHTLGKKP